MPVTGTMSEGELPCDGTKDELAEMPGTPEAGTASACYAADTHTHTKAHTHTMHAHTLACIHTHTHGICALVGAYAFAGVQPYAYTSRFQDERVCLHTTPAHLHTGFLANPNEFTSVTDAISIVQVPWERRLQVREKDCKLGVQIDVQETLQM